MNCEILFSSDFNEIAWLLKTTLMIVVVIVTKQEKSGFGLGL